MDYRKGGYVMINVILPVWITSPDTLGLTEEACKTLKTDNTRLIIVDNGSTLGGGRLRELADLYIRNKENLGYAKAVNQGLCLAGGIVAVANNDIRVSDGWVEESLKILELDKVGSVHFRMIPYDQPFNKGDRTWITGKERWCSSSMFVMVNAQLYDEKFLNSLDDWDYWRRFREAGWKTAYTNKVEYQHLDSHTQQKVVNRNENDQRNLDYYMKKYGEHPEEWVQRMYPEQMNAPWKPFP